MSTETKQNPNIGIKKKIFEAQKAIKVDDTKKAGFNEYSNFTYYTPEQVSQLCFKVCEPLKLLIEFDIAEEQDKTLTGVLTITDLETGEEYIKTMPLPIPDIKATSAMQKLGGAQTYGKRYLLQNTFDIVDNSIDPDANQRPQQPKKQAPKRQPAPKKEPAPAPAPKQPSLLDQFKQMSEAKRVTFLSEWITKGLIKRVEEALPVCEKNKWLTPISIGYINCIVHTYKLAPSQRTDYLLTLFNNKDGLRIINRVLNFVSKNRLIEQQNLKDLRVLLKSKTN